MISFIEQAGGWANGNQGVVSVVIFAVTLTFGWASGIFSALRRKPKFRLRLIEGPTFCCTYETGKIENGYDVHRTGVALYLAIANVGTAPSSIEEIAVAYHWNVHPFSWVWLRYRVGWFWLENQTAALGDFCVAIGENLKVFPFLTQTNALMPNKKNETYLQIGKSTNGVVYFEQSDSWGGCFPIARNGNVQIKVAVTDTFGKKHVAKFKVPFVSLEYARKFNQSFGKTLAELRGEPLPCDAEE